MTIAFLKDLTIIIIEPWHSNSLSADDSQKLFSILADGKSAMKPAAVTLTKIWNRRKISVAVPQ